MDARFTQEVNPSGSTIWIVSNLVSAQMTLTGKRSIYITGRRTTWNGDFSSRFRVSRRSSCLRPFYRYDPAAITTKDGALTVTLSAKETHGLDYQGGMMSTWNKFCFTGGLFQAAVTLPGANNIVYVLYPLGCSPMLISFAEGCGQLCKLCVCCL